MMEWKTLIERIEQEKRGKAVQTLEKTSEKRLKSLFRKNIFFCGCEGKRA
jgi:hypothetical protein